VSEHEGKPWVLFIIEDIERNTVDQKIIEAQLSFKHEIYAMRATFADVHREAKMDEDTGALFFRGKEIGLVYYRTGYSIEQYTCSDEETAQGIDKWKARELLE
jgi:glutathione synthase